MLSVGAGAARDAAAAPVVPVSSSLAIISALVATVAFSRGRG